MKKTTRTRKAKPSPSPSTKATLAGLCQEAYSKNKAKNAASRAEAKAKKEIDGIFEESGISEFETVTEDGTPLIADKSPSSSVVCDVLKLKEQVSEEIFLAIVSATKSAVIMHAGEAVFNACSVEVEGEAKLSVKVKK